METPFSPWEIVLIAALATQSVGKLYSVRKNKKRFVNNLLMLAAAVLFSIMLFGIKFGLIVGFAVFGLRTVAYKAAMRLLTKSGYDGEQDE